MDRDYGLRLGGWAGVKQINAAGRLTAFGGIDDQHPVSGFEEMQAMQNRRPDVHNLHARNGLFLQFPHRMHPHAIIAAKDISHPCN
jgi:hypothetical protein